MLIAMPREGQRVRLPGSAVDVRVPGQAGDAPRHALLPPRPVGFPPGDVQLPHALRGTLKCLPRRALGNGHCGSLQDHFLTKYERRGELVKAFLRPQRSFPHRPNSGCFCAPLPGQATSCHTCAAGTDGCNTPPASAFGLMWARWGLREGV